VSGNTANGAGGGIFGNGDTTVTNSTVSSNTANFDGGGIFSSGTVALTNSTVSSNTANGAGGGIIFNEGSLTLTNSTVSNNTASDGGGITNENGGSLTLTSSTVSGNTALNDGVGGGIYNSWGDLALTNSTVSGNTASGDFSRGGGIMNYTGNLTLTNSTVSGNTAANGSAIVGDSIGCRRPCYYVPPSSSFDFENSILAGSCQSSRFNEISSAFNLADDESCAFSTTDIVVADAMLGPLQDNGGPTETHDLLPGSPAIDAGSMDECPPPDTDQRGVARPQGTACDIGAVEYLPEPRGALALIAGAGFLALLYRRRRSSGARERKGQEKVKRWSSIEDGLRGIGGRRACMAGDENSEEVSRE
jgi:hypothetical protein